LSAKIIDFLAQFMHNLFNMQIHFRTLDQEKVAKAWDEVISRGFNLPKANPEHADIKEEFEPTDKELALKAIFAKDAEIITRLSQASFSDVLNMPNEDITSWLFQTGLNIHLAEEEFFPANAISGIPLELWIRLFQQMPPQTMETIKAKCKKANYSFDKFRDYLLGIKNVVKFCLDNHVEMISYYEPGPTGLMKDRAEQIYKRLNPEAAKETEKII
jgi:hypothetical protein